MDAIRSANRASRLDPLAPERTAIAHLNYQVGRTGEAVKIWEKARATNPRNIIALSGLAESRGRHAEAEVMVQEILQVNPALTAELAVGLPALRALLDEKSRDQLRDQLRSAGYAVIQ